METSDVTTHSRHPQECQKDRRRKFKMANHDERYKQERRSHHGLHDGKRGYCREAELEARPINAERVLPE
jgi:hypothetical protein